LLARAKKAQAAEEIQKRLAMKNLLGNAINDGKSLPVTRRVESDDDANAYESEFNAWSDQTAKLIENAYGKGEASRFMNYAGIELFPSSNMRIAFITSKVIARIQRLNELIPRVDTIVMLPDVPEKSEIKDHPV
jgi:hypothetical protein